MCEGTIDDLPWLRVWAPAALVLPLDLAMLLADQKEHGMFDLPSLNTAMIVLTSIDDSPLGNHQRDSLWRAFGVPIFEQLRRSDGAVIARECEVHDGLHIVESTPNLNGEIVADQCACGAETPRLRRPSSAYPRCAVVTA